MKFLDVPQSGSIADRVHSHGRAGQYTRNRRAPVQPVGSGRRATVRTRFGSASAAWRALTNAQRQSWESFTLDHPITDSLGQSIILTGHQIFVRVHASAANVEIEAPTAAIVDLLLPDLSPVDFTISRFFGVTISIPAGNTDQIVAMAFSRPFSPGRSSVTNFWQPPGSDGFFTADNAGASLSAAKYQKQFGTMILGQKVTLKLTPYSNQGWNGTPLITSSLVT